MSVTKYATLVICLTALLGAKPAVAALTHFALQFQHNRIELSQNDHPIAIDYSNYHIRYGEQTTDWLQFDLILGQTVGNTKSEPLTTGLDMSGYYAGLNISARTLTGSRFQFTYDLRYLYHDLEGMDANLDANLIWHELRGQLTAQFKLDETYALYGCGRIVAIQGEELLRGSSNNDFDFEQRKRGAACAGVLLNYGTDGYIGFEIETGTMRGANLYFGRYFAF